MGRQLDRRFLAAAAATVAGLAMLCLAGCAARKAAPQRALDLSKLVWPPAPDAPRVRYVQSIARPADVGIKPSGAARVWRWIVGADANRESLSKPFGIALDEQDNICISDTGANAVFYYDRARHTWRRWDKVGNTRFMSPVAVAKRSGTFYVADSGLGAVLAFNDGGKLLHRISDHLERPSGVAIVGDRIVVADAKRHAIVSFDLEGRFVSEFGHRGVAQGEFNYPTHVTAGPAGNLFVTDSMNTRVQMFDATGHFKSQIGSIGDSPGHFGRPKGVGLDTFGHVYVIDALFDNVQVFDREGRLLLTVGDGGELPGQFWLANGIAISRGNEIFVADSYNRRVQVFRYVGQE